MKLALVLVCAGRGQRLGKKKDKAFVTLVGARPLVYYAYASFLPVPGIIQIVVVARKEYFPQVRKHIRDERLNVVSGGRRRQDSVYNGLRALRNDITHVIIHDGARPFVEANDIRELLRAAKKFPAAILGTRLTSCLKMVRGGLVLKTLAREGLYAVQTPQVFDKNIIVQAYRGLKGATVYDDAQLLESLGARVKIVEGSPRNIKVTYLQDLNFARQIMGSGAPASRPAATRLGLGFDVHRFTKTKRGIVLAGVSIPCAFGVDAVSDGDVILHSVADGILGASGLGDIGDYFPPQDKKNRNLNSREIIKAVMCRLGSTWQIDSIDATVVTDKPRLAVYKNKMTRSLKDIFGISAVNVKIKSKEGLDILGGSKAISCLCLVSLTRQRVE